MQFNDMIGNMVLLMIPSMSKTVIQNVKLLGVEAGGLWIESQALTSVTLQAMGVSTTARTPIFFVPYHEITFGMVPINQTALDEKALGL